MLKNCPKAKDRLHRWYYDHSIYHPPVDCSSDSVAVHRQCSLCGKHEMAVSRKWRKPYNGYILPDFQWYRYKKKPCAGSCSF